MPVATHPWVRTSLMSWVISGLAQLPGHLRGSPGALMVTDMLPVRGEGLRQATESNESWGQRRGNPFPSASLQEIVQLFPAWLPSFPGVPREGVRDARAGQSPRVGAEGPEPCGAILPPCVTSVNHRWKLPPPPPRSETGYVWPSIKRKSSALGVTCQEPKAADFYVPCLLKKAKNLNSCSKP